MDKTMWPAGSNTPYEKDINFKFSVDAANPAVLLNTNPLNNYVASVARTGVGTYVLTFQDSGLILASFYAELSINVPSAAYAQAGPTTGFGSAFNPAAPPTATIFTLNAAGAAADPPAANPNVFVCGVVVLCDVAKV